MIKSFDIELYNGKYYDFILYRNPSIDLLIKSLPKAKKISVTEPIFDCLNSSDLLNLYKDEFIIGYLNCYL